MNFSSHFRLMFMKRDGSNFRNCRWLTAGKECYGELVSCLVSVAIIILALLRSLNFYVRYPVMMNFFLCSCCRCRLLRSFSERCSSLRQGALLLLLSKAFFLCLLVPAWFFSADSSISGACRLPWGRLVSIAILNYALLISWAIAILLLAAESNRSAHTPKFSWLVQRIVIPIFLLASAQTILLLSLLSPWHVMLLEPLTLCSLYVVEGVTVAVSALFFTQVRSP